MDVEHMQLAELNRQVAATVESLALELVITQLVMGVANTRLATRTAYAQQYIIDNANVWSQSIAARLAD